MKEHNFGGPFCDLGVHLIDSLLWIVRRSQRWSGRFRQRLYKNRQSGARIFCLLSRESGAYAGTFTPRPYDYHEFNVEDFANGFMRLCGRHDSVNFKFSWAVNLPTTNLDMVHLRR